MSTWLDPLRETSFTTNGQSIIGLIGWFGVWLHRSLSVVFQKDVRLKNTVLGGYAWGIAGTFTAFIILGNYGLAQQLKHGLDITGILSNNADYAAAILKILIQCR